MTYYHSKYAAPKKKKRGFVKLISWLLLLCILVAAGLGYYLYMIVYKPNVWTPEGNPVTITIPTNANFDEVKQILYSKGLIIRRYDFNWWARQKKYPQLIKPGRYQILHGMNNNELVTLLRSGNQVPVKVTFNNIRDIYELSGRIGRQIEADSVQLIRTLTDSAYLASMGMTKASISSIFIPNTYEFYWTTTVEGFVDRMYAEYLSFWGAERSNRLVEIGLTKEEVVTLASIVEKETNKNDEKAAIAGVYINRLKKGWLLQADPTLIYAIGDYNITRVLNVHKNIDSPYNTYKYSGLPPGPICIPSIASIDAVLNYEQHDYLYFCAKDDLSGYHAFAKTNMQHNQNARRYQKALDDLRIYN